MNKRGYLLMCVLREVLKQGRKRSRVILVRMLGECSVNVLGERLHLSSDTLLYLAHPSLGQRLQVMRLLGKTFGDALFCFVICARIPAR